MFDQAHKLRELTGQRSSKTDSSKKIISVTSGKGGTGKSFLSFYLSQFLSKQGYKTLLIECDFNLSSLSFQLTIKPEATIYDLFMGQVLFEEIPVEVSDNLFILFGDNGKLNFPENRIGHIRNLFQTLQHRTHDYDFVIMDNGAGIGNEVLEIVKNSDMNLIVTLPDAVAIMDAYVVIKMMLKNSIDIPLGVMVNKSLSPEEGKTAFENLNSAASHFFKKEAELIGVISESRSFKEVSLLKDIPSEITASNQIFDELRSAADKLSAFKQLANNHQQA